MTLFELAQSLINKDEQTNLTSVPYVGNIINLPEVVNVAIEYSNSFFSVLKNIFNKVAENILEFNSSEYEQKQVECHVKWAQYGWTYNNSTPIGEFNRLPNSLSEADEYMNEYCSIQSIQEMKTAIVEKGVCKTDLDEAYFCFKNKKYKASALIVFSLLDKVLIMQNKTTINKKGEEKKKIGNSAVKAIKNDEEDFFENSFLLFYLMFLNIMECLSKLYEYGGDFNKQPVIINRNFLSHGMYEKEITMLDCYKVWSALYSFTVIFPEAKNTIEKHN